tara:strand:+ start:830 stop:1009 length:180 start_codon:yes stop_codon:yes gene_type:complete
MVGNEERRRLMLEDIFIIFVATVITVVGFWANLEGFKMMDERRAAEKAGTHDYYGNKIE